MDSNKNIDVSPFWRRAIAFIFDMFLIGSVSGVLLLMSFFLNMTWIYFIGVIILIFGPSVYFALMHSSSKRATLGKQLMKIQVVYLEGDKLTFWRAFGREWLRGFLALLTYWFALLTKTKQTLHDIIVKTVVVCNPVISIENEIIPQSAPQDLDDSKPVTGLDLPIGTQRFSPNESPRWIISGFTHDGDAIRFEVNADELESGIVIGGRNKPGTQFIVPDSTVSGAHLKIRLQNERLFLTDLGSMNGTLVDDDKLMPNRESEATLQSRIQVGGSTIQLSKG